MLLLVSGATRTMKALIGHPNLGVLMVPRDGNAIPPVGVPWACDNGCYKGLDEVLFLGLLKRIKKRPDCMWVTCPDEVGNHEETCRLWRVWAGRIYEHGQVPAFVAQDGATVETLPWGSGFRCVFLGGTTRWKLGGEAARIAVETKRRGLLVHMGRVNTLRRLTYAHMLGVDSVDGSKFSKWSETFIPQTLESLAHLASHKMLLEHP